jgi:DNA-binding transcriptional ArsR family regulator
MAEAGELTASGVAVKASISRPLFLYHIKQLVGVGLVERREQGKEVFFVAKPQRLAQVAQWLLNLAARLAA